MCAEFDCGPQLNNAMVVVLVCFKYQKLIQSRLSVGTWNVGTIRVVKCPQFPYHFDLCSARGVPGLRIFINKENAGNTKNRLSMPALKSGAQLCS